ncbi:hypothetical protein, partial [Bacteroides sp.]|uniref:hypothetical protein n=1 Tax=Bacteroides sp. TaxID=29523 RepID=UPI003AB143CC
VIHLLHNYEKDIPRLCATTNYRGKDNEKQGAWQRNANLFQIEACNNAVIIALFAQLHNCNN